MPLCSIKKEMEQYGHGGYNGNGQLGLGDTKRKNKPTQAKKEKKIRRWNKKKKN